MRKAIAIMVCFGFLLLTVPSLNATDKRGKDFDFKQIIKKPVLIINSMLPLLSPIFDSWKYKNSELKNAPGKIKITGGLVCPRVSDGD